MIILRFVISTGDGIAKMRHLETAENVEIQRDLPIARRIFHDEEYTMEDDD